MLVVLFGCCCTSGLAESAPLRRTGLQTGRVTMAEANSFQEERIHPLHGLRPIMPHLGHPGRRAMDALYPLTLAAEDLHDQGGLNDDEEDGIYQHGLKIVGDIKQRLITDGRRRVE